MKNIEKTSLLPMSARLVKEFVVWASKKNVSKATDDESVKASTIKAYVAGIKV